MAPIVLKEELAKLRSNLELAMTAVHSMHSNVQEVIRGGAQGNVFERLGECSHAMRDLSHGLLALYSTVSLLELVAIVEGQQRRRYS